MIIDSVGLFQVIHQRMDYAVARHSLTAQNIAHADTPNYRPQDLKSFSAAISSPATPKLAATHSGHVAAAPTSAEFAENRSYEGWEVEPSGNGVLLEQEIMKAADIGRDYQLAVTVMRKHLTMLRAAMSTR